MEARFIYFGDEEHAFFTNVVSKGVGLKVCVLQRPF